MILDEFIPIFVIMAEYFGAQPSTGLTRVYFNAFQEMGEKDFESACQNLMNNRPYSGLPKISEIKEAIYGKVEDLVALAWESLMGALKIGPYESVIFEDGAVAHAIEAMGGWGAVNQWTIDECRMRRKEFESIYLANLRRGNIESQKLIGLFEAHNSLNPEWEKFTPKTKIVHSQVKEIQLKNLKLLS